MRKLFIVMTAMSLAVPTVASAHSDRSGHRAEQGQREWRGADGRYYCRKSNGTVGLVVGAAGGALVGRAVDSGGSRASNHLHFRAMLREAQDYAAGRGTFDDDLLKAERV